MITSKGDVMNHVLIMFILLLMTIISGCASTFGGSSSPEDLMTKKVSGDYTTKYEMTETFDCLARWVGTKIQFSLRREIAIDGLEGHLFWKDQLGWVNFTYLYRYLEEDTQNALSLYISANLPFRGFLYESAAACTENASSWPGSEF
jgi:hypothetical protein